MNPEMEERLAQLEANVAEILRILHWMQETVSPYLAKIPKATGMLKRISRG